MKGSLYIFATLTVRDQQQSLTKDALSLHFLSFTLKLPLSLDKARYCWSFDRPHPAWCFTANDNVHIDRLYTTFKFYLQFVLNHIFTYFLEKVPQRTSLHLKKCFASAIMTSHLVPTNNRILSSSCTIASCHLFHSTIFRLLILSFFQSHPLLP